MQIGTTELYFEGIIPVVATVTLDDSDYGGTGDLIQIFESDVDIIACPLTRLSMEGVEGLSEEYTVGGDMQSYNAEVIQTDACGY